MKEASGDTTSSTTTGPTTSSSATNPPSTRMNKGVKVPVLAVGTYHRKQPQPILAAAELQLNSATLEKPTDEARLSSADKEMRGPPPAWQPPRPPATHDYTNDYEDPEDLQKQRDGSSRDFLLKTSPTAYNSYEMSLSQQRRSAAAAARAPPLEWSGEPEVLHKNADGAYYIPSGSLRTTTSTISPASATMTRYLDQPHVAGPSSYSDASASLLKGTTGLGTQTHRSRRVSHPKMSVSEKKKESDVCAKPSRCTLFLVTTLAAALLVIILLLLRSPSYVYTQPSPSYADASHVGSDGLRALPSRISLGQRVEADFLPKHMATTELFIPRASRVVFNVTVGTGAQLVLLTRAGVPPALSLHDALFPIRADRINEKAPLHVINEQRVKRYAQLEFLSPRSTTFEQFLLEGRHFLTFINERNRNEPMSFVVSEAPRPVTPRPLRPGEHPLAAVLVCEADCNHHGECVHGKCRCAPGFSGNACEEAVCPIVCSGNGVFSGGFCVCQAGFKGRECEMRSHWCEVADCNGRGRCGGEGKCVCEVGWTGDACEKKSCAHATCHDRGVCVDGVCYCRDGWRGADCSVFVDTYVPVVQQPAEPKSTPMPEKLPIERKQPMREVQVQKQEKVEDVTTKMPAVVVCDEDGCCGDSCRTEEVNCTCENGDCNGQGECVCWSGYQGAKCEYPTCAIGCEEHGKCQDDGICACQRGWNGENCFQEGCPRNCSSHGECVLDSRDGFWSCRCQVGRRGDDCAVAVELDCDDSLDNDNDGLLDCEDPDCCDSDVCSSESVCSTAPSPAEVLLRMPPVLNAPFYQRVKFLVAEKSVQSYTDPNQFNESSVAVVRGRVMWRSASDESTSLMPLAGVRVSDAAHHLYGFTLSRVDGYFDLVVNGGRSINLQFLRNHFQGVKYAVFVPPHEIVHIDDVIISRDKPTARLLPRTTCSPSSRTINEPTLVSSYQLSSEGVVVDDVEMTRLVVDSRAAVQTIPVPGTSLSLVFDSSRVASSNSTLLIGLLSNVIDSDLRRIHLRINVAGRNFEFSLSPKVNLTHVFAWDKMNAYRQREYGLVKTNVQIGYEYRGCERDSEIVWITRRAKMLGATSRKMEAVAWTLDVHHHLDVVNNIVELGNGGNRFIGKGECRVETIAGTDGTKRSVDCDICSGKVDKSSLLRPTALAICLDDSIVVGDHNLVRRLAADGSTTTLLVLSEADASHAYYLAVSPIDGSIVISLAMRKQIWKIVSLTPDDPRHNYEIIAGDGSACSSTTDCGDKGPATSAKLAFPKGIAFDRLGNLYVADSRVLRVIDTAGIIRTLGESSRSRHPTCSTYDRLSHLQMEWPTSVSCDATTDVIYILDVDVVLAVEESTDSVRTVLGRPTTCTGNESSTFELHNVRDIAVDNDGSIFVVESDNKQINQIRRLSPDRSSFSIFVGGTSPCSCDVPSCGCDNAKSTTSRDVRLSSPTSVAVSTSGSIVIADTGNAKLKKVSEQSAAFDHKTRLYTVVAPEKNEVYKFNRHGLHVSTNCLISSRALFNFSYTIDSPLGRLSAIHSIGGLVLRLVRHNETDTDVQAPNGQIMRLVASTYDGMLETVRYEYKEPMSVSFDRRGLLHSTTSGALSQVFVYDDYGRASGLRRDGQNWHIGPEKIISGRVWSDVYLNGIRFATVKIREGDVSVEESGEATTRLISMDDGFSLTASGLNSLFDSETNTLHGEKALLRRRTTVAAQSSAGRRALTTRWDWRFVTKKGETRRVSEINGVNYFSVEFDVAKLSDTLRGRKDETLLVVEYADSGEVKRIHGGEDVGEGDGDENRIAEMNVTFDSLGRRSEVRWGKRREQATYDAASRIVERSDGGATLPLRFGYEKSQRYPNRFEQGGDRVTINYDSNGRLKEVVTAQGEKHAFSAILLGGGKMALKRRYGLGEAYLVAIDGAHRVQESMTSDGMHHFIVRRDAHDRVTEIFNDGVRSHVHCWHPDGSPLCIRSPRLAFNVSLQGPLVAFKSQTIDSHLSSMSYEYDDLLRPIVIHVIAQGTAIEPIRISYDERTGCQSSIDGFSLLNEATLSRTQGHGLTFETSRDASHRELTARKWIVGDARLSLAVNRDDAGRAVAVQWTTSDGQTRSESWTFDALGRVADFDVDANKVSLKYDKDGRILKRNDEVYEWLPGGVPKRAGDVEVDANGWTTRRANTSFIYDALGRLVGATSSSGDVFVFIYDHLDRLVAFEKNKKLTTFLYVLPHLPYSVSHVIDHRVTSIFYDDVGVPFALLRDGFRFAVAVDQHASLSYILSESGIVKEIRRDVFGRVSSDSNPDFWIPIGYLGGIDIAELDVSILRGRPLDLRLSRFLSFSPSVAASFSFSDLPSTLDLFSLSSYQNPHAVPRISTDFNLWFSLTGLSSSLLPTSLLGLPRNHLLTYRILSSFPSQLTHFSHILSILPSPLVDVAASTMRPADDVEWSVEDAGFANLFVVSQEGNKTLVNALPVLNAEESNIVRLIGDGSQLISEEAWPMLRGWHVLSSAQPPLSQSLPHLTVLAAKDAVELRSGNSKLVAHFSSDQKTVRNKLHGEQKTRDSAKVWKAERRRALNGLATSFEWSDTQLRELKSKGSVSGFSISSRRLPSLFSSVHNWRFKPSR